MRGDLHLAYAGLVGNASASGGADARARPPARGRYPTPRRGRPLRLPERGRGRRPPVPQPHGRGAAVVFDLDRARVVRVGGIRFPDGIAYAPEADKLFVSDERGAADVVIDARTLRKRATVALGGKAGNTHYDSVSKCMLVAVQTRGELVALDPATERVVARYPVPGVQGPHGFTLDEPGRRAFVTGEGNAALAVVDLRTMRVVQRLRVGDDPDVLAWDPGWRRLYVASESGVLSTFSAASDTLVALGDLRAPHAHTVAVDPRTHRVYLPLENVGGRPVLRALAPSA